MEEEKVMETQIKLDTIILKTATEDKTYNVNLKHIDVDVAIRIVEDISEQITNVNDANIILTVTTPWQKKANIEYERNIYTIKANNKLNADSFKVIMSAMNNSDNNEKIFNYLKDGDDGLINIVEEKKETIEVNDEQEINTTKYSMKDNNNNFEIIVDPNDVKVPIENRDNILKIIGIPMTLLVVAIMIRHSGL